MSTWRLLDANVISDLMHNPEGRAYQSLARIRASTGRPAPLCTSVIVDCELRYGLSKKPHARLLERYHLVMQGIRVVEFQTGVAQDYGRIRTALESAGQPIGPNDTLIAAHALALEAILVTDNEAEFRRVPGLQVENWLL